ncbi:MAG: hypothetical protein AB1625_11395 [Acidobacteriota bacterium]
MNAEVSALLLQVLVMGGILAAFAAVASLVQGRRLRGLAGVFEPGSFGVSGFLPRWAAGQVGGYPCRYRVVARGKNQPGGARLEVRAVTGLDWMAIRPAAPARAMASAGVLQDVEIGDTQLDRALRFVARDPGALQGALAAEGPRAALGGLLCGTAFASILVRPDLVRVQWKPRTRGSDEDPAVVTGRIRESLTLLAALGCAPGAKW